MLAGKMNAFLEIVATTSKPLLTKYKILIQLHSGCVALAHKIVDSLRTNDLDRLATFLHFSVVPSVILP